MVCLTHFQVPLFLLILVGGRVSRLRELNCQAHRGRLTIGGVLFAVVELQMRTLKKHAAHVSATEARGGLWARFTHFSG